MAILATIICIVVLLPLYEMTPCDPLQIGEDLCQSLSNNTDFEKLTIANVPPHRRIDSVKFDNGTKMELVSLDKVGTNLSDINVVEVFMTYELQWIPGITGAYVVAVECQIFRTNSLVFVSSISGVSTSFYF